MQKKAECTQSATRLLENLEIGDRVESTKSYNYLNFQRGIFHKLNPDRRIVVMQSKFKEGVTIVMRAE